MSTPASAVTAVIIADGFFEKPRKEGPQVKVRRRKAKRQEAKYDDTQYADVLLLLPATKEETSGRNPRETRCRSAAAEAGWWCRR